jgi:hypothetical protein
MGVLRVSDELSLQADAADRYRQSHERARWALEAWIAAERPFTITHSNRTQGVHPLYRALTEAEQHAERMSRPFQRSRWFVPRIEPSETPPSREHDVGLIVINAIATPSFALASLYFAHIRAKSDREASRKESQDRQVTSLSLRALHRSTTSRRRVRSGKTHAARPSRHSTSSPP